MTGIIDRILEAPAAVVLSLLSLGIVSLYALARARPAPWAPTVVRVLAVLGIVVPVWQVLAWADDLRRARDLAQGIAGEIPFRSEPVVERFLATSAGVLALGFLVLVAGIYLARRLPGGDTPDAPVRDAG